MTTLKNMGDLRLFLVETMQSVRDGTVDCDKAGQVAKLAAQINASIHAEIAARVHLQPRGNRPFNALALIEADGEQASEESVESGASQIATPADMPHPVVKDRPKDEPAEWYPNDWPEIQLMLGGGKSKQAIAELYGVSVEQLDSFIEEQSKGEAPAPARTGA
jgi:hypothetical protein